MATETSWKLFGSNEEAWDAMLYDCAKAKESIALEQFIFVNDDFGKKLIAVCAKQAANGVSVRFLWDAAGSFTLWGSNIAAELKKMGIELVFWKTLVPSYFKLPDWRYWYLRNHRRTLTIDGKIGYTGSICVNERMKDWHDTNLRVDGTVARQMENAFDRMWDRARHARPLPRKLHYRDNEFRYLTNYPAPGRRLVYREFIRAIRKAAKRVFITTPYFVPTHRLVRLLKSASERGVEVRVVLPEKSDYRLVDLSARSYFTTLLESGVKIFLYRDRMLHGKTITVDDSWASVGSMNLDRASLLYNFEANIVSTDDRFAREVASYFRHDLESSREVTLREWRKRSFVQKVLEFLVRFVRKFL